MEKLTFAEVTKIEGAVGSTNSLIAKYAKELGLASSVTLPTAIHSASEYRIKVERVHGVLVDIAKIHATQLAHKLLDANADSAAALVDSDAEFNSIIDAIVSLNGANGLGHQTVNEIAKLTSTKPTVVARVKQNLERRIHATADKFLKEGRIVMDIIRHTAAPQKQCLFSV